MKYTLTNDNNRYSQKSQDVWQELIKHYIESYEKAGFCVIPLANGSKVPQKGLDLAAIYDGREVNVSFNEEANVGIVTGRSRLVVIDCDSEEAAEWFERRKNYIDTAKVLTKRGKHYYYLVPDASLRPMSFKELQIDIKAGRSYVVAPPSVVQGHVYRWSGVAKEGVIPFIATLSLPEIEELIKELEEFNELIKSRRKVGRPRKLEENIQKMIEILSKYYIKGQRQDLILAIAGIARKEGIPKETVLEIVERLYQKGLDDSLVQRYSAVEYTFRKAPEEVAGWSILQRFVTEKDLEELKKLLGKKTEVKDLTEERTQECSTGEIIKELVTDGKLFVLKQVEDVPTWYYVKDEKKKILVTVCPYFEVIKKYVQIYDESEEEKVGKQGRVVHIVRTLAGEFQFEDQERPQKAVKYIGAYIKHMDLFKDLFNKMANQLPFIRLYHRTGWLNNKIFLHPCIPHKNIEIDMKNYNSWFVVQNKKQHHEFVKRVLEEGKLLGIKIVFSVASLFTEGRKGFVVIDVGERGIGKTLTSKLAVNLFYDSRTPHTLQSTMVAMELIMRQFTNLPILFDEVALTYDEKVQALIFMVSSAKGKGRGTPSLTVKVYDLQNVLFLTTEREIDFDRLGVYRRFIYIKALRQSDYTDLDLATLLEAEKYIGCGVDYIKYLMKRKKKIKEEGWLRRFEKFDFLDSIEKAVVFLERYYNCKFEKLRERLEAVLEEQHKEAAEEIYEVFIEKFRNFIAEKENNFVIAELVPKEDGGERIGTFYPKGDCFGFINFITRKVHILTNKFREFCKNNNLPLRTVLMLAKQKGDLLTKTENFRSVVRIPSAVGEGFIASVYSFFLDSLFLEKTLRNRGGKLSESKENCNEDDDELIEF